MNMLERIPEMTDQELATLHGNAQRLESAGAPAQQKAAAEMLPAINAELAEREARKPKKAVKTAKPRKTAAKKAAPAPAED